MAEEEEKMDLPGQVKDGEDTMIVQTTTSLNQSFFDSDRRRR